MKYRKEIDGLRALAVLPVILFHAGFPWFSGGYVGVDVFFVISGYLITSIILTEIEKGEFSFSDFYERRARRILPALYFVIFVTIPFAWVYMLPSQFRDYTEGLAAVSLFVSNILFWSKEDYFAPAAEENPLLHTWSLAVEEQFYIFFPLLLLGLFRYGRVSAFYFIMALTLVSLGLAEYGSRFFPSSNFYMLYSRAWELGAGAICAFILIGRMPIQSHFLSTLGVIFIIISIAVFDKATPFPSLYTLLPVIGTMLIILFASEKTFISKLLSQRVFVGIGLISFSAYLWHQPLFAFAHILTEFNPSMTIMLSLSLLSLVLAVGTWRYVEKPFREKRIKLLNSRKILLSWSWVMGVLFIVFGWYVYETNGLISRFTGEEKRVLMDSLKSKEIIKTRAYDRFGCFFDQSQTSQVLVENNCVDFSVESKIILFGDSEAAHYFEGLKAHYPKEKVFQWTGASCRPFYHDGQSSRCALFLDLFFDSVVPNLKNTDTILIAANWEKTHGEIGAEQFSYELGRTIEILMGTKARVIIFGNTPDFPSDPFGELVRSNRFSEQEVYLNVIDSTQSESSLSRLAKSFGVPFVSPASELCGGIKSRRCLFKKGGEYLFFDQGHLSFIGSKVLLGSPNIKASISP